MKTAATLARRIQEERVRQGMSQRGLASRMKTFGYPVDPSAITRIENLARRVSVPEFLVIAAALNVSPFDLLMPKDGTIEVADVHVASDVARRWFSGEDPKAVLRSLVRYEAEAFARTARPGDTEWAGKLADTILGNDDLFATFEDATRETPKKRSFLIHMVMSTAACGGDFQRDSWTDEGGTE